MDSYSFTMFQGLEGISITFTSGTILQNFQKILAELTQYNLRKLDWFPPLHDLGPPHCLLLAKPGKGQKISKCS